MLGILPHFFQEFFTTFCLFSTATPAEFLYHQSNVLLTEHSKL